MKSTHLLVKLFILVYEVIQYGCALKMSSISVFSIISCHLSLFARDPYLCTFRSWMHYLYGLLSVTPVLQSGNQQDVSARGWTAMPRHTVINLHIIALF